MLMNQGDDPGSDPADETEIGEKTDASDAGTPEDASNNVKKSQAQSTSRKAKGKTGKDSANRHEEPEADESSGSTADQGGR